MKNNHTPWWGRIGIIWLIFVPLCTTLYVLAQPLAPHDFWYHLRAGAWMVDHLQYPRTALFTPSVPPGTPYFYQSWIAEVVMFLIFKWSGLAGSQIVRAICFSSAIAVFVIVAQKRTKVLLDGSFNQSARRVAIAALAGMITMLPNTDLRPQAFSLPLFAVFAAILFTWSNANPHQLLRRIIGLIALMILWANLHGAFATGLILLCFFCIGETLHFSAKNRIASWAGKPLTQTQLALAWTALAGSLGAACINPRGWAIYAYVLELTGNVINLRYNQEWQPPTWNDGVQSFFFCCGLAILVMALLLIVRYCQTRRPQAENIPKSTFTGAFGLFGLRPSELFIIAAFFVMALRSVRSIIWFALLFIIVGAALICRILPAKTTETEEEIPAGLQKCNLALSLLLCFVIIPILPWFKSALPWPATHQKKFIRTPVAFRGQPQMLLSNLTPIGAATFLQQNPPQGLLWNDMVFGSYLVWALYPNQGPWADPRIELRPDGFWYRYMDTCHARNQPERTLIQQGFSDALINKKAVFEKPLQNALQRSPKWQIVYEDQASVLYRNTLMKHSQ